MPNWRELTVDEEFLTQDEQAWFVIWELVLKPGLEEELAEFNNVTFLWKN